jgi:hypothetical protein
MRFSKIIFLFLFTGLIFSCSKSSDSTTTVTPKTTTELLAGTVSRSWKSTSAKAKNAQNLEVDFFSISTYNKPCILDNLLVIFPNKTYELREGALKCAATDPDLILKANWTLSTDQKTFTVDKFIFAGRELDNVAFKITELTETSLITTTKITYLGQDFDATLTFAPAN